MPDRVTSGKRSRLIGPSVRFEENSVANMAPKVGLLNKSSCLAAALGVSKFIIVKAMNSGHTLLRHLSRT